MSQILRQLSWAAKSTRVRVNSVTPAANAPLTGYEAIPMTLVVEGRYLGITNFLGLLRTQVRAAAEQVRAKGRLYSVDNDPVRRQLRQAAPPGHDDAQRLQVRRRGSAGNRDCRSRSTTSATASAAPAP